MAQEIYNANVEDPSNVIRISRSDGSLDHVPLDTTTYELIPKAHKASKSWRGTVGTFVAKHSGLDMSDGRAWYLEDWPSGYTMWVRKRDNRADYYLFGFKKRFSSPREFAFHALWLYSSNGDEQCKCTVCTGRHQGEINEVELGEHRGAISGYKPKSQVASSMARNFTYSDDNMEIQVFRKQLSSLVPKEHPPSQCVARERDSDLRTGRIYRIGEIVWVQIPPLVVLDQSASKPGAIIRYWPALIQEQRTRCTVIEDVDHPASFSVVQTNCCLVLCLGVMQVQIVKEDEILPYLALQIHPDVEECIKNFPTPDGLSSDCRELRQFKPFTSDLPQHRVDKSDQSQHSDKMSSVQPERNFFSALGPLALSLRTARRASTYWSLSHKWRFLAQDGTTETRWQGLFMGPERIWLGDLVRITCNRSDLDVAEYMLPPSPGAAERGLLVHISSIATEEGMPVRMVFSGLLYEVAPEEWSEDGGSSAETTKIMNQDVSGIFLSSPARGGASSLPSPPAGFKFRQISAPSYEICMPLSFIGGRYYPPPVLRPVLDYQGPKANGAALFGKSADNGGVDHVDRLLSLVSLSHGSRNQLHCKKWKKGRVEMMQDADSTARTAVYTRWSNAMQLDEIDPRAFII